jgi:hypothetical protein
MRDSSTTKLAASVTRSNGRREEGRTVTVLVEADGNEPPLERLENHRDVGGQTPVGETLNDDCISTCQ